MVISTRDTPQALRRTPQRVTTNYSAPRPGQQAITHRPQAVWALQTDKGHSHQQKKGECMSPRDIAAQVELTLDEWRTEKKNKKKDNAIVIMVKATSSFPSLIVAADNSSRHNNGCLTCAVRHKLCPHVGVLLTPLILKIITGI